MTHRRVVLVSILAISLVLLVAAIVWNPSPTVPEGPSTGLNVVVLGVDGLDWFLLGQYMEQGLLPNINRIARSALTGNVAADMPALPQVGWTVAGSGGPLTEQELNDVARGNGRLFGVVPELATLVERDGGRALVVGWPGSWPVRDDDSPAIAPYQPGSSEHTRSLAPALFQDAPGEASRKGHADVVDEAVSRNMKSVERDFAAEIHEGPGASELESEDLAAVEWGYLADRTTMDVAGRLIAEEEPDLAMVYLGGLDTAVHRFLGQATPEFFEGVNLGKGSCADVVPNYYSFVDDAVGRLLRLSDERTLFLLVSVYGSHPSTTAPPSTGGHELGPPGVLLVRGPHLPPRERTLDVTTADLAPTVLASLGLPVPLEATGRVLTEALPEGLLDQHPVQAAEAPANRPESIPAPPECALMDEMVKGRLEALSAAR